MPTLQDVARRAGVSTATVSKVLSNTPYFTEETRRKVMHAVDELGYVPNLAARALAAGKTHIVAVVFPYVYEPIFSDPLTLRILGGIESVITQRGYNMLLSTPRLSRAAPDAHYLQLVQSGYLDGLIAIDNVPEVSVIDVAREKGLPSVVIGYDVRDGDNWVHSDDVSGGEQIMTHVLELGHRAIGLITVPENINMALEHRLKGLRTVAEAAGLDFDRLPRADGDFSTTSGAAGAADLLSRHPELTALICLNDRMALGAIQQARLMGRRVPGDLTVTGYDDIPAAASFAPPLTTIDQRAPESGQTAAHMLFDILAGATPDNAVLPVRFVERESTAAPYSAPDSVPNRSVASMLPEPREEDTAD
ncbi:MAG: LacI family DNA-binding transcriptional regulator [Chloroflexota bacterium]|mgnify:CR=1 FL=1|nr:LacI family transcriptional regulator [Anaerolineae bacterium]HMM28580.1 LacI family DNA-binding transcriptional regulator [Aggregatilineaceae bacterium]